MGKFKERKSIPQNQNMGEAASDIFAGKSEESEAIQKIYNKSPLIYAEIIRRYLPAISKLYKLVDLGSHKGELVKTLLFRLPEYKFQVIALDTDEDSLSENKNVDYKIVADAEKIPLADKSVDLVIARYILQWNSLEKQKRILSEIKRIVSNIAIVEHVGADNQYPDVWRERINDLFDGEEVPKLKRKNYYFSSRDEIERWMSEAGIKFERILDEVVQNGVGIFTKRYNLSEKEVEKVRKVLAEKDYICHTVWVINGKY